MQQTAKAVRRTEADPTPGRPIAARSPSDLLTDGGADAPRGDRRPRTRSSGRDHGRERPLDLLPRARRAVQPARPALRARGVAQRGRLAILLENQIRYLEVVWAAQRSGLAYTTVNTHLTAEEAGYIIDDCGASVVVSSAALAPVAAGLTADLIPHVHTRLMIDGAIDGWEPFEDAVAEHPATPIDDEAEGDFVLYSSGTTGRPKGIQRPLTLAPLGEGLPSATPFLKMLGLGDGDVYLCPAPLYHAAPSSLRRPGRRCRNRERPHAIAHKTHRPRTAALPASRRFRVKSCSRQKRQGRDESANAGSWRRAARYKCRQTQSPAAAPPAPAMVTVLRRVPAPNSARPCERRS